MQRVGAVVDGELMRSAVESKLPFADAYVRSWLLVSARKPAYMICKHVTTHRLANRPIKAPK